MKKLQTHNRMTLLMQHAKAVACIIKVEGMNKTLGCIQDSENQNMLSKLKLKGLKRHNMCHGKKIVPMTGGRCLAYGVLCFRVCFCYIAA